MVVLVVAVVFFMAAAVFALLPNRNPVPLAPAAEVPAAALEVGPRFTQMGDDAMAFVSGFNRNCMECHGGLVSRDTPRDDSQGYHDTVVMDHGMNGRCVNCHHLDNRNMLAMRSGEAIGFSQSSRLCSNCHGPAYRQWQRGVHGKTLGHWDTESGTVRRLQCVECHDPHSPHFGPMAPLPPPNTLRMGPQNPDGHGHEGATHALSPLMRAEDHDPEDTH